MGEETGDNGVNVFTYFDEWTRCLSSRYQFDSLYRHGEFDACSAQWSDLKLAFKAKGKRDPKEAKQILEKSYYLTNLGSDPKNSPTSGVVWDLKQTPGWDVEETEK